MVDEQPDTDSDGNTPYKDVVLDYPTVPTAWLRRMNFDSMLLFRTGISHK